MTKLEPTQPFQVQIELAYVFDDVDVEKLAQELELGAIVRARNRIARTIGQPPRKFGVISVRSEAEEWASSFERHWSDLKQKIAPIKAELLRVGQKAQLKTVSVIVDNVGRFPVIKIQRDFQEFLREFDAILELDVYDE